jgi:glutamate---cysteine ligase / carboxylate-amine ligase
MTLGVEIEIQILEASTLDLTPGAPRILDEVGDTMPYIKPELFQSVLEINTGICRDVHQVRVDLTWALGVIRGHCAALGLELGSAGTHPFSRYIWRLVYPAERYRDPWPHDVG